MNSKKKCPHITSNDLRVIQAIPIHKITDHGNSAEVKLQTDGLLKVYEVEKKIVRIHDEHKETAVG